MSFEEKEILTENQIKGIIHNMISEGRAGFFSWDIDNNKFDVLEGLTGRAIEKGNTFPNFIHQLAYEKDREMALQDLKHFLTGEETTYQSTFRVLDIEGNIRWIFAKGSRIAGNILSGVMYNVSSSNLMQGHNLNTNLMNGETFTRKLANAVEHAKYSNQTGALLYIDLDNFPTVMNKYGYEVANELLYKASRVLLRFVGDSDEIGHFSYNKFMILLNDVKDAEEVERISQEICTIFEEPLDLEVEQIYLNIHIGVTIFPEVSRDAKELIRFSDFAISHSRKSGNNLAVFFDSKLMASYNREMDIENELPGAISDEEFYLVYQPQINLKTKQISGFEALVRWENKNLGLVTPNEFIPVAENKGYIVTIGQWIRKETIKTARKWLDKGIDFEKISVNVSNLEFRQKYFKERLLRICKQYQVDPKMIELEMTESMLMNTNEDNKKIMEDLMDEGFKIALDDFGTGYSNFSTLLNFKLNTLKLDKSLIDNINDETRRYFLKSIISSKDYLHYDVIAEGVEDQETLNILCELDCDTVQGYYFSKPLPKIEMEEFIADFQAI